MKATGFDVDGTVGVGDGVGFGFVVGTQDDVEKRTM